MTKVLVLYYSSYGHIEKMAEAVADGARSAGAQVDIKRVPETVPEAIAKSAHFKLDQVAPVATVADLENYDAIIVGTGTRFGRMSSQMAAFLDQAEVCGRRAHCTARLVLPSHRAPLSTAARKRRCSRSSPIFCISG